MFTAQALNQLGSPMNVFSRIVFRGLIALMIVAISSCSSTAPSDPTGGNEVTPVIDLEYKDNTRVFGVDEVDVLIDSDTTSGTYTFDATKFGPEAKAGDVIIVSGKIMRKVVSSATAGGQTVVETEDAVLTDAVKNGTIAWVEQPEFGNLGSMRWGSGEVQTTGDEEIAAGDTLMFEITRSGVRHVVQIIPKTSDGKLSACDFTFQMTKVEAGKVNIVMLAKGEMTMPVQETKIVIKNGVVDDVIANNRTIKCNLEFTMSAAAAAGGDHSLVLPGAALQFPIRYLPTPSGLLVPNPIPMSIGIGIQFVTKVSMPSAESSAQASAKLSISTDAGFEYHGTSVSSSAKLNNEEIKDGSFDAAAFIGIPVNVEFGVAFPRVSLNIVGQEFAWIHTGFTTGATLQWGPVCKSGYAKMTVEGGYNFGFLGLPTIELKKNFVEREKRIDCD